MTRRCEARVTRDEVVPVIDFDHITILGMEVGVDDHAAGRSVHRGSLPAITSMPSWKARCPLNGSMRQP